MKLGKRILALLACVLLCFAPAVLMVGAAESSDIGPCGHSLADYTFTYNDRPGLEKISTASECCWFVYDNAEEVCDLCGYSMAWPVSVKQYNHVYVSSPDCVYCDYIHP